jgi:Flp pilus assembly protein TadG
VLRPPLLRRLRDDERGVTVVIVALSLIALFGMTVLVVDVGSLLWHRREMVNAADAAALAAAKTCAVPTTDDPSDPVAQADQAAGYNETGLGATFRTAFKPGPSSTSCSQALRSQFGSVTVSYERPHDLFFAPVLGFGQDNDIATTATAAWGSLGGGNAIPIVLESGQFQTSCDIPDVPIGTECWFWYDPGVNGIGVANWGFLDMQSWPQTAAENTTAADCGSGGNNSADDDADAILNDYDVVVNLFTPYTYVCTAPGGRENIWFGSLQARLTGVCGNSGHGCRDSDGVPPYDDYKGPSVLMPVNDCNHQINQLGQPIICGSPEKPYKYAITGFTTLELLWILQGNDTSTTDGSPAAAQSGGTPASFGDCGSNGASLTYAPAGSGLRNLGQLADNDCGGPTYTGSESRYHVPYSSVVVTTKAGNVTTNYKKCLPGDADATCDYWYNDQNATVSGVSAHTLQWRNAATLSIANKSVNLTWNVDAVAPTPGKCGFVPPTSNAICIGMVWQGYTPEPGPIGTGPNFGTVAIELCDHDYSSCPAGTKPTY